MDIKFHITKIMQSGSSADDWMNFIDQLKHNKCDRDLLTQIYTVALNNIPVKGTKVYKKLLVGLANLQSETSPTLAQKTLVDANCLDIDCAVVCVYNAQFEYQHKNKNEAFRILRRGKCDGRTPKFLIKKAYQNLKEGRPNLFDGVADPWDDSLYDVTDTSTITQPRLKTEPESPKKFGIRNPQVVRSLSKLPSKSLGMPTRTFGKTQSASSLLKDAKTKSPTEVLKEKLGLMVGDGFDKTCQRIEEKYRSVEDSGVFMESGSDKENKENMPKKVYGPSLSPFMVHASPLVNRKQMAFFEEKRENGLKCDLFDYFENENSMKKSHYPDIFEDFLKVTAPKNNIEASSNESKWTHYLDSKITKTENLDRSVEILKTCKDSVVNMPNFPKLADQQSLENPLDTKAGLTDLLNGLCVEDKGLQENEKKTLSSATNDHNDTLNEEQRPESYSTSPKAFFQSQPNSAVTISSVNHQHKMVIAENPVLKVVDPITPVVQKRMPCRKPLTAIKSCSRVDHSSVDRISQARSNSFDISNPLQPGTNKIDTGFSSNSKDVKIDIENRKALNILDSNLISNNEANEIKQSGSQKPVTDLNMNLKSLNLPSYNSSTVQEIPRQNALASSDNAGLNVEKLVASGLEVLGQNGFNVGMNLQQLPSNRAKVFTVNGSVYKQIKCIGKGGSCKVFEVVTADGHVYALKRVKLQDLDTFMIDSYLNEIKWLEKLKGDQHIIELNSWERTAEYLLLVMELGEKDLANVLRSNTSLTTDILKVYWKQMLNAVQVIHQVGIVHADLKPANFLFVGPILKLIDFGIANGIQGNKTSVTREYQMGTLNYMPPEALMADNTYADGATRISRASDVWSLGCMLYLMVFKKTPYQHIKNQNSKMVAIQRGHPIEFKGVQDPCLLDCLQGCLRYDKRERYTIEQLLLHDFLKSQ